MSRRPPRRPRGAAGDLCANRVSPFRSKRQLMSLLALYVDFTQSVRLPKLGAKPTYRGHRQSVENDPKPTWAVQDFCSANWLFHPISPPVNPCCNCTGKLT
jgi:hypothetical protein